MNIKDIAAMAGTSVATVSRVINCSERVAVHTRKRVLEVFSATGYRPDLAERALKGKEKDKILILLPSIANPFFAQVVDGIEQHAGANGYDSLICITHRDIETEKRYMDLVRFGLVKGLLFFTSTVSDSELEVIASKYPVVQCGAHVSDSKYISYSCIDNVAASCEAVSHLIALGNERIAIINGPFRRPYETERHTGYLQALIANGIDPIQSYMETCDYNHYEASVACARLMSLATPPTALFCSSDQMAAGAMKFLVEKGLVPGEDVDVIGFDGTFLSEMYTPSITCIEQPGNEMGKTAFGLLLERIEDNQVIVKKVVLPHKLILRQSTKKPSLILKKA